MTDDHVGHLQREQEQAYQGLESSPKGGILVSPKGYKDSHQPQVLEPELEELPFPPKEPVTIPHVRKLRTGYIFLRPVDTLLPLFPPKPHASMAPLYHPLYSMWPVL